MLAALLNWGRATFASKIEPEDLGDKTMTILLLAGHDNAHLSDQTAKALTGNVVQTVQSSDAKKVITVRTASFAATAEGGSAAVEPAASAGNTALSRFVSDTLAASERPELTSAEVIISGGRALGSSEKFQVLFLPVADKLGAAVGASRAAVDAPNDWQVGQTGKVMARSSISRSTFPARSSIWPG
nr:FAD-binding protein [Agrobacterium tumefaciens]